MNRHCPGVEARMSVRLECGACGSNAVRVRVNDAGSSKYECHECGGSLGYNWAHETFDLGLSGETHEG